MDFDTYLVCVSHDDRDKGTCIIKQFLNSENRNASKLLFIENGCQEKFKFYNTKFSENPEIDIFFINNPNKAISLNYLIKNKIPNNEDLILCIDDDVKIPNHFVIKYKEIAKKKGNTFFFGAGMIVDKKYNQLVNKDYRKLYQQSQFTKDDKIFCKIDDLMFLGCNYGFFKSQWHFVNGFDDRFAPGSKFKLGAEESVFQKKLKYAGFKPCYIENNQVIHHPNKNSYKVQATKKRTQNNGYTHGFQYLINSNKLLKYDYLYRLLGMVKSLIILKLRKKTGEYLHKKYYSIGYLKAFILYLKIKNKKSIYYRLKKV